ncbi:MAG TPA: hypothetical protein VNT79_14440 [Phycisphaerae bacterium]|nr:hypothetical protein [Phycisphaerae bacterium]
MPLSNLYPVIAFLYAAETRGALSVDASAVLDGLDIQAFVLCVFDLPGASEQNCSCADMDGSTAAGDEDVSAFVDAMLAQQPCQ